MAPVGSYMARQYAHTWRGYTGGQVYFCQGQVYLCQGQVSFCQGQVYLCQGQVYFCQGQVYFCQGQLYFCQFSVLGVAPVRSYLAFTGRGDTHLPGEVIRFTWRGRTCMCGWKQPVAGVGLHTARLEPASWSLRCFKKLTKEQKAMFA